MGPEASIEQAFVRWCTSQGLMCPKLQRIGKRGWPDRCVLLPGNKVVWIEFKAPGGKPSPQQIVTHREMEACGHSVCLWDNLNVAKAYINKQLNS